MSAANGTLHRYAYGDLAYCAERDTSLLRGLAALLLPTPAPWGTGSWRDWPRRPQSGSRCAPIVELHGLQVERDRVQALRNRLDTLIAGAEFRLPASDVELVFVPHPRQYSLAHNSNQVVADWLTELGCDVSRRQILSGWRLQERMR